MKTAIATLFGWIGGMLFLTALYYDQWVNNFSNQWRGMLELGGYVAGASFILWPFIFLTRNTTVYNFSILPILGLIFACIHFAWLTSSWDTPTPDFPFVIWGLCLGIFSSVMSYILNNKTFNNLSKRTASTRSA